MKLCWLHIVGNLMHWLIYDVSKMRICKVKKDVHQQHVNCLINTWVFASKNMAINSVRHVTLCNIII